MKRRFEAVVLGMVVSLAAAACSSGKGTSGAGSGGFGSGGGTASGSGGAGGGGGGQGGMCDPTYTCAQAIDTNGDSGLLCDGPHGMIFDKLIHCICMGTCAIKCEDNTCVSKPEAPDCTTCIDDTVAGCGSALMDCTNDK